ncbi:MAG: aldehyde dehydrogenase family protein [Sedimenticola sp.]|nr:aldehyde dehydrogenase family protein [Sedimenticola sp.]
MKNRIIEQLGIALDSDNSRFPGLARRGLAEVGQGAALSLHSPIDGGRLGTVNQVSTGQVSSVIEAANNAFRELRNIPAPRRGELVRQLGNAFRQKKQQLGELISLECGKILQESLGEVQEVIDICDFAVGLSRQLHGLTIASERPEHRMMEQWHPLGPVAVISAFNFPMAVWSWNTMISIVCGNPLVWKPSEKAPLCALACQKIISDTLAEFEEFPEAISQVVIGDGEVGQQLAASPDIPLVSATGSVPMGRKVATTVAARLGRSLLELGGNNAMIVASSADIELALRAIVFSAVGTCGQRCTSLRRLIVHESIIDNLLPRLADSYRSLPIGNPFDSITLVGPLIDQQAYRQMQQSIGLAREQGGTLVCGGNRVEKAELSGGWYVEPAIVSIDHNAPIVQQETFAPILYVMRYREIEQAIAIQNGVPQGLSSAIFTTNLRESELFLSSVGSDCGLANVNIGTSGAEIGGAFGGEKATGGGRESGSDAWKNYMRRATNTINYGHQIPLAQGINFG